MKKIKVDNVIFLNDKLDMRAGGPCGYLANLKHGIETFTNANNIVFITKDILKKTKVCKHKLKKAISKYLTILIPTKKLRKKYRENIYKFLTRKQNIEYLKIDATDYVNFVDVLDKYEFKTIICHYTRDAIFVKNYLLSRNLKSKILLMSHSPEPPSQEIYHSQLIAGIPCAYENYKLWQNIEKEAFNLADIMIFPSREAMEPYLSGLDYFKSLINKKEVYFIPTGCNEIDITNITENIKTKYNITTKYIISYIGRHTKIKGYDILQEVAKKILAQRQDVTFVIAGSQTIEFEPLQDERWIELGRINPANLLSISDLFILPNRQTYFDLILLEVLSSGVPVVASNTGGNTSVYNTTKAIELYDTKEELIQKINEYLDMPDNCKRDKKILSKKAYESNYTLEHFAHNYIDLIKDITKKNN